MKVYACSKCGGFYAGAQLQILECPSCQIPVTENKYFSDGADARLHAAGGILPPYVYEPVGSLYYVFVSKEKRLLLPAKFKEETNRWSVPLDAGTVYFEEKPLDLLLWQVPTKGELAEFLVKRKPTLSNMEAWQTVESYFESFGDYEEQWHPTILALTVMQTHLCPICLSLFQLGIEGDFGTGKTTILESLAEVSYHGILANSVSAPARVRMAKRYLPSWFQDEFDSTTNQEEDNLTLALARVSQRRGNKYIRWNMEKDEPEVLDTFQPFAYTLHSAIERALAQRALASVVISKSGDFRIPVINQVRTNLSRKIGVDLWFWRLQFLADYIDSDGFKRIVDPGLTLDSTSKPNDIRQSLYEEAVRGLNSRERRFIELLRARENELCFTAVRLESALGVNILDSLVEAINRKFAVDTAEVLEDNRFVRFMEVIQAHVTNEHKTAKLKELMNDVEQFCGEHKLAVPYGRTLSPWLRALGFRPNKNHFHKRDGIELVFDSDVKNALQRLNADSSRVIANDELNQEALPVAR